MSLEALPATDTPGDSGRAQMPLRARTDDRELAVGHRPTYSKEIEDGHSTSKA